MVSCYEPGRDGFWVHRALTARGITNVVVDSAGIDGNRRGVRSSTPFRSYAPHDRCGLLRNGTLWIARGTSNRVVWIDSSGRLTHGSPRAYASIRTTDADLRRLDGLPTPAILDTITRSMSPVKAPFQNVVASADGEIWFWLNQPAGYQEELYAVVGADGSVKGALLCRTRAN